MIQYLGLGDFLVIAETVLDVPAEVLALSTDLNLADSALHAPAASFGGYELHRSFARKAAVLCSRLCNNHPLLDGNKRVSYEALREFVARNGYYWTDPIDDGPDGDETVKVILGLAAGQINEDELTGWIEHRIGESG
ncbi:MAG: type II toxin-antitoxin system death-on-curing family toxin [Iamia sp.]